MWRSRRLNGILRKPWEHFDPSALQPILVAGVVLATVPVGPGALLAQGQAFKSAVELVALTVTVTDRTGRYVPDLTAADFAVFEQGQRQAISHFVAAETPIEMWILLDTSRSMRDDLPLARKAARGLVRQLRDGDQAAVAAIGSTVSFHQPMTLDLARVHEALGSTLASGDTALNDALYIVLRTYQQKPRSPTDVTRRIVVLLSDGIDTASHVKFEEVLDLVRRVDVTFYVVSLVDDATQTTGSLRAARTISESAYALSRLAGETGGRLFKPRAAHELPAIYDAIAEELRSQYVIGYVPNQPADGMFRRLSVGVLQPRVGAARTRAGYYAERRGTGEAATSGIRSIIR